jgi:heptosyltransferase-1
MSKILIVKTSSMGDVIHTLPAITDAAKHFPGVNFTWVVEPAFAEIPTWHPSVVEVIPVPFRKFRKKPVELIKNGEVRKFFNDLRKEKYDYVIDAQGLLKSAFITAIAKGLRCGLDRKSAWEPLACLVYQKKANVNPKLHAITRMRQLFSRILEYSFDDDSIPDYGLNLKFAEKLEHKPYLIFIHGTTWLTKEWPESYWAQLAKLAVASGYEVLLPWGNLEEEKRAVRIKGELSEVKVLPKTSLSELANLLAHANGAVSVDTGLGHLAAALSVPTVSIYGPTDPKEVGTVGRNQQHLSVEFNCSPCWNQKCGYQFSSSVTPACFTTVTPSIVWHHLTQAIEVAAKD